MEDENKMELDDSANNDVVFLEKRSRTPEEIKEQISDEKFEKIRYKYHELTADIQDKAEGAGASGVDVKEVQVSLLKANEIFYEVKRAHEAAMDSRVLNMLGSHFKRTIETKQSSLLEYRPMEFTSRLIQFLKQDSESEETTLDIPTLARFGKASLPLFKRTYGIQSLSGVFEQEAEERITHSQRIRDENSIKTVPEKLCASQSEETNMQEVVRVHKELKKCYKKYGQKPIDLMTFAVNPHNFGLTIENLFHISFLVRDAHAEITEDENGLPVIAPYVPDSSAESEESNSNQAIICMDMSEWREIVETFEIKEPMIPPPPGRLKHTL